MEDLNLQAALTNPLETSPQGGVQTSAPAAMQIEHADASHAAVGQAALRLQREREIQSTLNNKLVMEGLDAISTQAHKNMGVQRSGEQPPPCTPRDNLRSETSAATSLTPRARLTPRGRTGSTEGSRLGSAGLARTTLIVALQEACELQGGGAAGVLGGGREGDVPDPHQLIGSASSQPSLDQRSALVGTEMTGAPAPVSRTLAGNAGRVRGGDAMGEGRHQSRRARRRAADSREVASGRFTLSSSTRCESIAPIPVQLDYCTLICRTRHPHLHIRGHPVAPAPPYLSVSYPPHGGGGGGRGGGEEEFKAKILRDTPSRWRLCAVRYAKSSLFRSS